MTPKGFCFLGKLESGSDEGKNEIDGELMPPNCREEEEMFDIGVGLIFKDDGTKYFGAFFEGRRG